MTISAKLYLLILGIVGLSLGLSAFLHRQTSQLAKGYQQLIQVDSAAVEATRSIQINFRQQVQEWKDILLRGADPAMLDNYQKAFLAEEKDVDDTVSNLLPRLIDPESHALIQSFSQAHKQIGLKYALALADFRGDKDAHRADMAVKGIDRPPSALLNKLEDRLATIAQDKYVQQSASVSEASRAAFLVALCSYIVAAFFAVIVVRNSIVKRLRQTRAVLERVATGDLTISLAVRGHDELAGMSESINQTIAALRANVSEIRAFVLELADTSTILASATHNISQGAQKQAASVEQISAALEEMSGSIRMTSENTRRASEIAAVSALSVEQGGHHVSEASRAMSEIKDCTLRVSQTIGLIGDIAFQTNLLAVNAAIQAAHAGDQGKGFNVVASEVRELAKRTSDAASQIALLTRESDLKVLTGSTLTEKSGETLSTILTSVRDTKSIVAEIATASFGESAAIEQVSKAISNLDGALQNTTHEVQRVDLTASTVSTKAVTLQNLVAHFITE